MARQVFQAGDIARLIGIPERRLAKFMESSGYGLQPSVRASPGRKGTPRLYSQTDVQRIALAWWLYQVGLRPSRIGSLLRTKGVVAVLDNWSSVRWDPTESVLLVLWKPTGGKKAEPQWQELQVVRDDVSQLASVLRQAKGKGGVVIPLGYLQYDLQERMKELEESGE